MAGMSQNSAQLLFHPLLPFLFSSSNYLLMSSHGILHSLYFEIFLNFDFFSFRSVHSEHRVSENNAGLFWASSTEGVLISYFTLLKTWDFLLHINQA